MAHVSHKLKNAFEGALAGGGDPATSPLYVFGPFIRLIVVAGVILLVFPAVIWGIKFSLWPYFIVDRQTGPVEALRASSKATSGVKWDLLGFYFVVSVVQVLGILCLVIGLFAAWPTAMVATALVYRRLLSQTEGV